VITSLHTNSTLAQKIESLRARIELLTSLGDVVTVNGQLNLSPQQWEPIQLQLNSIAHKLLNRLNHAADKYLTASFGLSDQSGLADILGEIEIDLSQAYSFYDTFMDILTQRTSPVLGPLLRGCDTIAADGLKHLHLSETTRSPIVYCDRGFGASILREGVSLTGTLNPIAFIAIPYSRLAEKYNLISIYHEVGHQALAKLSLITVFQEAFRQSAQNAGANKIVQGLFSNWSKEIIPDFWAFGHTGMAQTSSMKDVLFVPNSMAFTISPYQVHPPSYLRFLISVEWCRFLWGMGDWDNWAEEWESFYSVRKTDGTTQDLIRQAKRILPQIAQATITTKFKRLGGQSISSLFDWESLNPHSLNQKQKLIGQPSFCKLPTGIQLAAFRLKRDKDKIPIQVLNNTMKKWLINLPKNNQ
jgi:hypothetical protein